MELSIGGLICLALYLWFFVYLRFRGSAKHVKTEADAVEARGCIGRLFRKPPPDAFLKRPRAINLQARSPPGSAPAPPPRAARTSPAAEPPARRDLSDSQLLNRRQVAQRLQIPASSMYAAISAGDFPRPIRVGSRSVRWFAREIDAWVESRPRGGGAG